MLVLPLADKMLGNMQLIKQQFKAVPGVLAVSRCVRNPIQGGGGYNMRSSTMPSNQQIAVTANPVDEDFIKTTGLQIIAGSDFTEQDNKDVAGEDQTKKTFHFILNEAAAKQLGWTAEQAVGKKMFLDDSRPGLVKAVVKDYHFESLHKSIKPMVLFTEIRGRQLLIKLKGDKLAQTIAGLGTKWKNLVPYMPFEYHFMDEDYNKLYNSEIRLGNVLDIFAAIAIVLACLGLFGLSAYSAQQRVKEIGVRKILGANLVNIIGLLSKDFILLVLVAFAIAIPIAWLATEQWLQGYEYRISVTVWLFVATGAATIFITLLTVSFQAAKVALGNPVKSLRME